MFLFDLVFFLGTLSSTPNVLVRYTVWVCWPFLSYLVAGLWHEFNSCGRSICHEQCFCKRDLNQSYFPNKPFFFWGLGASPQVNNPLQKNRFWNRISRQDEPANCIHIVWASGKYMFSYSATFMPSKLPTLTLIEHPQQCAAAAPAATTTFFASTHGNCWVFGWIGIRQSW